MGAGASSKKNEQSVEISQENTHLIHIDHCKSLDTTDPSEHSGCMVPLRASIAILTEVVTKSLPDFKSYTTADPTTGEIMAARRVLQLLLRPACYLEFYNSVYAYVYAGNGELPFSNQTISFKNSFLLELMRLLVFEGSAKSTFSELVRDFGEKYWDSGVLTAYYGSLGEAIVRALKAHSLLQSPQASNVAAASERKTALWAKLYSRFVRSLVPSLLILEDAEVAAAEAASELLDDEEGDEAEKPDCSGRVGRRGRADSGGGGDTSRCSNNEHTGGYEDYDLHGYGYFSGSEEELLRQEGDLDSQHLGFVTQDGWGCSAEEDEEGSSFYSDDLSEPLQLPVPASDMAEDLHCPEQQRQ